MRIAKEYNNRRMTETIGGQTCNFRSQIEYKVALYLQLLKKTGHIKQWGYEKETFQFPDDKWLIDFVVTDNDDSVWYIECKGVFEARDRKKVKLLFKYMPDVKVLFVFYSKADIKKVATAAKFMWWRKPITLAELTNGVV